MTVKELCDRLQKLMADNKDVGAMEVSTEGCDCWGNVGNVEVDTSSGTVLLERG